MPPEPESRIVGSRAVWYLWLATVALIVVGSLVWWVMLVRVPEQHLEAYNATQQPVVPDAPAPPLSASRVPRPAPAAPDVSQPAYPQPVPAPGTVWVNTRSSVYHYPGYRWFGATIQGKFMRETDAVAEGDRAAKNERRPVDFGAMKR